MGLKEARKLAACLGVVHEEGAGLSRRSWEPEGVTVVVTIGV